MKIFRALFLYCNYINTFDTMLDYTNKEFVRSFCISDFRHDRTTKANVIINGRHYTKHGTYCATTLVANHWKVFDPSVEQFKHVYLVGVARQHPNDNNIRYSDGVEIAEENAFANPCMMLIFEKALSFEDIENFMWKYLELQPIQFIRTKEEKNCMMVDKLVKKCTKLIYGES